MRINLYVLALAALILSAVVSMTIRDDYKGWVNSTLAPVNDSVNIFILNALSPVVGADNGLKALIVVENNSFAPFLGYAQFYNQTFSPITGGLPDKVKFFITGCLVLEVVLVVMRWK